jgi:hypothetical protein
MRKTELKYSVKKICSVNSVNHNKEKKIRMESVSFFILSLQRYPLIIVRLPQAVNAISDGPCHGCRLPHVSRDWRYREGASNALVLSHLRRPTRNQRREREIELT